MKFLRYSMAAALLLGWARGAEAENYIFGAFAGYAGNGAADGTSTNAQFVNPQGIAVDGGGNIYVADSGNNTIRRISSAGIVSTMAGQPGISGSANGAGTNALFCQPAGLALDASTNIYVADFGNSTIRKITPAGVVSTLAGSAGTVGSMNGMGTNALFAHPAGVALDAAGNVYVADYGNDVVRVITTSGTVSTLAAGFYEPTGIAFANGVLYVADTGNNTIRQVTLAGAVTTIAGTAGTYGYLDAQGGSALFYEPTALVVDGNGNIFVADSFNGVIRQINGSGMVSTLIGPAAGLFNPMGIATGPAGNVYIADTGNGTIREGTNTIAGSPSIGSNDGPGSVARLDAPQSIAVDGNGNAYVADTANSVIREISPGGVVTTLAGSAGNFGSADGAGTNALFFAPQGVAVDASGTVYVADTGNNTIRKIVGGAVTTIAGVPGLAGTANGTASSAHFNQPAGIAVDGLGNIYVADTGNNTIREISSGVVSNVAGSIYLFGSADGTGTNALFHHPRGVAVDASGNIFVADTLNYAIREILSGGVTVTVAGNPGVYGSVDGAGSNALFNLPSGLSMDAAGILYVADTGNQTLREIVPGSFTVLTIAGSDGINGSADGAGAAALFSYPSGIAAAASGYFFVADSANNTIRLDSMLPPQILTQPQSQTNVIGATTLFTIAAGGTMPLNFLWQENGSGVGGNSNSVSATQTGDYWAIVSNPAGSVTSLVATLTLTNPLPGSFQAISLLGDGAVQLTMSGTLNANYFLQGSTDLINWTTISSVNATNAIFQYAAGAVTNFPARFYRLTP